MAKFDKPVVVMTGATQLAAGEAGLVPAPSMGATNGILRSDGTWANPAQTISSSSTYDIPSTAAVVSYCSNIAGAQLFTVTLDAISNANGSYSHDTTVSGVTSDYKVISIEASDPTIFKAPVTVTTGSDTITVACTNVIGSSTLKVSLMLNGNNAPINSTEYNALDARVGSLTDLTTPIKTSIINAINSTYMTIDATSYDMSQQASWAYVYGLIPNGYYGTAKISFSSDNIVTCFVAKMSATWGSIHSVARNGRNGQCIYAVTEGTASFTQNYIDILIGITPKAKSAQNAAAVGVDVSSFGSSRTPRMFIIEASDNNSSTIVFGVGAYLYVPSSTCAAYLISSGPSGTITQVGCETNGNLYANFNKAYSYTRITAFPY